MVYPPKLAQRPKEGVDNESKGAPQPHSPTGQQGVQKLAACQRFQVKVLTNFGIQDVVFPCARPWARNGSLQLGQFASKGSHVRIPRDLLKSASGHRQCILRFAGRWDGASVVTVVPVKVPGPVKITLSRRSKWKTISKAPYKIPDMCSLGSMGGGGPVEGCLRHI